MGRRALPRWPPLRRQRTLHTRAGPIFPRCAPNNRHAKHAMWPSHARPWGCGMPLLEPMTRAVLRARGHAASRVCHSVTPSWVQHMRGPGLAQPNKGGRRPAGSQEQRRSANRGCGANGRPPSRLGLGVGFVGCGAVANRVCSSTCPYHACMRGDQAHGTSGELHRGGGGA